MRCEVRATRYLGERRLSSGGVCGAAVGILVRGSCCSCPLIRVAQRRKVTAVLNAGVALKLFTHSITVKDVALTGLTLDETARRKTERQIYESQLAQSSSIPHPNPFVPQSKLNKTSHWPPFVFTKMDFAALGHANFSDGRCDSWRDGSSVNLNRPLQSL